MNGELESSLQDKIAEMEKALGSDNPGFADSLMVLAGNFASSGKCMYAEPLFWRSLALRRKLLGEYHPKVAETLNCLAELYETYEQFPEAERLYQWVLRIREQAVGRKHIDCAMTLECMARVIREQHRDFEAAEFEAEAEAIWLAAS